uniref:Uncharacterized protein n=1 Tax=Acrobeloides nanus TaxID=290746 RepID=A0A914C5X8_9BILA
MAIEAEDISIQFIEDIKKKNPTVSVQPLLHNADENLNKANKVTTTILEYPDWSCLEFKHDKENQDCSPICIAHVKNADLLAKPKYQVFSPYFKPFLYGFTLMRNAYVHTSNETRNFKNNKKLISNDKFEIVQDVIYYTPCGKRLKDMSEVASYLKATKCETLSIDNFTFKIEIRPNMLVKGDREVATVVLDDFARGLEDVKIAVLNAVNDENFPNIGYRRGIYPSEDESIQDFMKNMHKDRSCCSCTDDCSDPTKCACQIKSIKLAKTITDVPNKGFYEFRRHRLECTSQIAIYECNDDCKCSKFTCFNRVVQNKIKIPVEIFMTGLLGWGVRTLVDIPVGTFITSYTGNVLTDDAAEKMASISNADKYFVSLTVDHAPDGEYDFSDLDSDVENSDLNVQSQAVTQKNQEEIFEKLFNSGQKNRAYSPQPGPSRGYFDDLHQVGTSRFTQSSKNQTLRFVEEQNEADFSPPEEKKLISNAVLKQSSKQGRMYFISKTRKRKVKWSHMKKRVSKSGLNTTSEKLRKKKKAFFVIDAHPEANLGAFLNHSCTPNAEILKAQIETHDPRMPNFGIFATRDIRAGEELMWDYGYVAESVPGKEMMCLCASDKCRVRLL